MKITCIGAAGGEVTGSAYTIQRQSPRLIRRNHGLDSLLPKMGDSISL